jgi:hypothetical protein
MYYWAMENDAWLQFNGVRRSGNGYIGQEIERLVDIAMKAFGLRNGKTNGRDSVVTREHRRVQSAGEGGS